MGSCCSSRKSRIDALIRENERLVSELKVSYIKKMNEVSHVENDVFERELKEEQNLAKIEHKLRTVKKEVVELLKERDRLLEKTPTKADEDEQKIKTPVKQENTKKKSFCGRLWSNLCKFLCCLCEPTEDEQS